jgi:hypothetical protein
MTDQILTFGREKVLLLSETGPQLASPGDANDFLALTWGSGVGTMAIPRARLGEDFLRLSTRLAGEVMQKFVNYGVRLVVLGDIADALADSAALSDFVREANVGRQIWFLPDEAALAQRLDA